MNTPTCATCRFWTDEHFRVSPTGNTALNDTKNSDAGSCHAFPPIAGPNRWRQFPMVLSTDWCGEWEAIAEKSPPSPPSTPEPSKAMPEQAPKRPNPDDAGPQPQPPPEQLPGGGQKPGVPEKKQPIRKSAPTKHGGSQGRK